MYNNTPIKFVCAVGMLFWVQQTVAESNGQKTYMKYPEWNLLPKGIDFDDEDDIAAIQQLVDEGPAANEAMLAIVRECDDSMIVSRALATLRESAGDKQPVVAELKRIFEQRYPPATGDESWIVDGIAAAISDIGTANDMDVLVPMLTNSDIRLRVMGARYFGKRGGQSAIMVLENARDQYPEGRFRQEIDTAIANIAGRQAVQDAESSPVP